MQSFVSQRWYTEYMRNRKYIFIFICAMLVYGKSASALDISYETIAGINGNNILIQKYGLETKSYFLCSLSKFTCISTKKKTLPEITTPKDPVVQTLLDQESAHITLSPLKNYIAYYNHNENVRKFTLKNISTGKDLFREDNLSYWDLLGDQNVLFAFTPDEKTLLYLDDISGSFAIYKSLSTQFDIAPFSGTKLQTGTLGIQQFLVWDNSTLFFIGNTQIHPYNWSLYKYDLENGTQKIIAENVSNTSGLRKSGGVLLFAAQERSGFGPRALVVKDGKVHYFDIPNVNRKVNQTKQEVVAIVNRYGIVMEPTINKLSKTPPPLVIWLHGGPYRQSSYGYHPFHSYGIYDSILEAMRAQGAIVLKLDYSGSLGFGKTYAESVGQNVGKGDVADVIYATNYMKTKYNIGKVYLMGNSYGGYLSLKTIVDNSEKFDGVISINGVTDWESLLVRMQNSIFNTHFNGLPDANNRTLYEKASILKNISKLENTKPIIIIQGSADRTIAPWQAPLLGDELKSQNKKVTMVSYKGEDHVFAKAKNIRDLCKRMFTFAGLKNTASCSK